MTTSLLDRADRDDLIQIGRIVAPYGVRGYVKIFSYSRSRLDRYPRLYDSEGQRSFVLRIQGGHGRYHRAQIEGIDDRDQAQSLAGTDLYALRCDFPGLASSEYYHTDLIGLEARDSAGKVLGKIKAIENHGAGDVLSIKLTEVKGKVTEVDIPFHDDWVRDIHRGIQGEEKGWMTVLLPDDGEDSPDDAAESS